MTQNKRLPWLAAFLPGILVAATGVGAGDLLTATLAGSEVGLALLWAAAAGALLKWTLNEGIARWQMATDTTLLEGWMLRLGGWIQWVFMPYFFLWTFMVGGALVNACGVAGASLLPLGDMETSKIIWGIAHSLAGLVLVWWGGYKVFEKMMAACIAVMFVGVLLTAVLIGPDWGAVLRGVLIPTIPPGSTLWILGVLGGVGGTVTLLAYGYFLREIGRKGESGLKVSRIDLGVAYGLTALFGMAMIIIGSRITIEGGEQGYSWRSPGSWNWCWGRQASGCSWPGPGGRSFPACWEFGMSPPTFLRTSLPCAGAWRPGSTRSWNFRRLGPTAPT